MSSKQGVTDNDKATQQQRAQQGENQQPAALEQQHPAAVLQRVRTDPQTLSPRDALHLQRTLGNQAVGKLIASVRRPPEPLAVQQSDGTTARVQRYIEGDPALANGKVSEGGNIAMQDNKTVYATDAKILEANTTLNASPQARFKLAPGAVFNRPNPTAWAARFGPNPPALKRVKPVFKQGVLTTEQQSTQPVEGDTPVQEQRKLAKYKEIFSNKILAISDLKRRVKDRWHEEERKRSGTFGFFYSATGLPTKIWGEFNGQITALMNDAMGPLWATTPAALALLLPQGDARNRLTLKQHLDLFDRLAEDYLAKFSRQLAPEIAMGELWMTLPNDCKNAAQIMTGKSATELNAAAADPNVGENYTVHFPASMQRGWATHYASVIMKDTRAGNTDNLSFETAASVSAGMQEGKSLGFFEMYGTRNPLQTFEYISWRKNRANVDQQVAGELNDAPTGAARQRILDEQAEDRARIDLHLAAMTPLPDDDDF